MKSLQELTDEKKAKLVKDLLKHPRHKFLDEIVNRVNYDRVLAGYKRLPVRVFAIKTAHLSMDDMGFLLKKMSQSSQPGKVFFGSLKVK